MGLSEIGQVIENTVDIEPEDQQNIQIFIASQWQLMWWRFLQHKLAVISGIFIAIMYILAIFADFFSPYSPNTRDARNSYMGPQKVHLLNWDGTLTTPYVYGIKKEMDPVTFRPIFLEDTSKVFPVQFFVKREPYKLFGLIDTDIHLYGVAEGGKIHLLGTDSIGRDMLSQTIHGARISLFIGLFGVLMSLVLGIIIGGISGYVGGAVDIFVQRLIEVLRAFPSLALWMALSAALPRSWTQLQVYFAILIILSLIGWTTLARQVRGKMLSLREEDFIMAARLNGCGTFRLLRVHMVPSFMSHIIATLTLAIPGMILGETALSFLGVGLSRPIVSWGVLLQQAQNVEALVAAPWLFIPGFVLVLSVLAFNFLGDGLRDAADPYSKL